MCGLYVRLDGLGLGSVEWGWMMVGNLPKLYLNISHSLPLCGKVEPFPQFNYSEDTSFGGLVIMAREVLLAPVWHWQG